MKYETSVGFVIVDKNNHFLLLQRTNNKIWDFPKGHINNNESVIDAATRELFEETKIKDIKIIDDFKHEYDFINPKKANRKIILFLARTNQNPELSEEHCAYKWCELNEAVELLKYSEKINTIRKAMNYL